MRGDEADRSHRPEPGQAAHHLGHHRYRPAEDDRPRPLALDPALDARRLRADESDERGPTESPAEGEADDGRRHGAGEVHGGAGGDADERAGHGHQDAGRNRQEEVRGQQQADQTSGGGGAMSGGERGELATQPPSVGPADRLGDQEGDRQEDEQAEDDREQGEEATRHRCFTAAQRHRRGTRRCCGVRTQVHSPDRPMRERRTDSAIHASWERRVRVVMVQTTSVCTESAR